MPGSAAGRQNVPSSVPRTRKSTSTPRGGHQTWLSGSRVRSAGAVTAHVTVLARSLAAAWVMRRAIRYRASLFMRQQGLCGWCGEPLNADLKRMHVDHVMPVSRRGPSADWNFQLLHGRCNTAKGPRLTDRAYDLAAEHGFVIPDFIAVWEQPVSGRKYGLRPKDRAVHWRPATGPVHLVHPGLEGTTLCGSPAREAGRK
jgi:hypothetical protein